MFHDAIDDVMVWVVVQNDFASLRKKLSAGEDSGCGSFLLDHVVQVDLHWVGLPALGERAKAPLLGTRREPHGFSAFFGVDT